MKYFSEGINERFVMLNRDIKMMEFARRIAMDNPGVKDKFKLAAVLTYKRDVISVGINTMRTHPMQKLYCKNPLAIHLHAEIACISNALSHINKNELRKSTLYIHRVKRKSSVSCDYVDGLACPCEGCESAIVAFGIGRVIYSTNINKKYTEVWY
jgi:tRNA(Arg) A34 adenosine deaminase TadA